MYTLRRIWLLSILLFIASISIIGGWVWINLHSSPARPVSVLSPTPIPATTAIPSIPSPTPIPSINAHLVIPAISVNAPIEPVGTDSSGAMQVPQKRPWDGTGWYEYGTYPGKPGSAVIDGHLDRPGGAPATFWNLRYLHVGDAVLFVDSTSGKTLHFRVTELKLYTPAEAPLKTIFANDTGTFLNLITCAGSWVPAIHQTTQRLVVFTQLV